MSTNKTHKQLEERTDDLKRQSRSLTLEHGSHENDKVQRLLRDLEECKKRYEEKITIVDTQQRDTSEHIKTLEMRIGMFQATADMLKKTVDKRIEANDRVWKEKCSAKDRRCSEKIQEMRHLMEDRRVDRLKQTQAVCERMREDLEKEKMKFVDELMEGYRDPLVQKAYDDSMGPEERQNLLARMEQRISALKQACFWQLKMLHKLKHGSSLEIAQKAVRILPESADSYILKAEIQAEMGRKKEALDTLRLGFCEAEKAGQREKHPELVDSLWTTFQRILNEQDNACSDTEPTDSTSVLPLDVLGEIFSNLDRSSLPGLMAVCPLWRTAVLECTPFLRQPVFKKCVTVDHVQAYVKLCEEAGITHCQKLHILAGFGQECGILRVLGQSGITTDDFSINMPSDIELLKTLTASGVSPFFFSVQKLTVRIDCATQLRHIRKLMNYFNLATHLSIKINSVSAEIMKEEIHDSVIAFPHLQSLELNMERREPELEVCFVRGLFSDCEFPALKSFSSTWQTDRASLFEEVFTPTLNTLSLNLLTESLLEDLAQCMALPGVNLESLRLVGDGTSTNSTPYFPPSFASLRRLAIDRVCMDPYNIMRFIEETEGNLEELSFAFGPLSMCRNDDSYTIWRSIVLRIPKAKKLICDVSLPKREFIEMLTDAMRGSSLASGLEELGFMPLHGQDSLGRTDILKLLGDRQWLPCLKRISGVRNGLSEMSICWLEEELGLELA